VSKTAVDRVTGAYADWYLPYSRMLKPHTPLDTRAKNQAKKAGKSMMISFTNEHIRNS
jgi:hypothetical protein